MENGKRHQLYIGKYKNTREKERDRTETEMREKDLDFFGTFCEIPNGVQGQSSRKLAQ